MIFLAQHEGEGPQSLKAFSTLGTPEAYMEQLLGTLRRADAVYKVDRGRIVRYHSFDEVIRDMEGGKEA